MDIFSSDPGTVVLADVADGTPMTLVIDAWGGFNSFRSIITGFKMAGQGGVQFMHTLNDFIFVYTFGERLASVGITGMSFWQTCQAFDQQLQGVADHGLEEVIGYYGFNRVNARPQTVTITLGTNTSFECFLVGFSVDLSDAERTVGQFNLDFKAVP